MILRSIVGCFVEIRFIAPEFEGGGMATLRRNFDLCTKRAYDPPEESDGARILVDRLWPRGLRKENAALSVWLKEVAPSPELRKWFGHDPARWDEFSHRYRAELAGNCEAHDAVVRLTELLKRRHVTLLYAAHDTAHNHALVLAAYLCDHLKDEYDRSAP
jgi:uncharacterized protein YeaO (DUF488 family)